MMQRFSWVLLVLLVLLGCSEEPEKLTEEEESIEELIIQLGSDDSYIANKASEKLVERGDKAVPELLKVLELPDTKLRHKLVIDIFRKMETDNEEALKAILEHEAMKPEDIAAISVVLSRWREGYENEDVDMYMSSFWKEGFRWASDMGTGNDKSDDQEFSDIRQERESAIRVFSRYQDIEIEISEPSEITAGENMESATTQVGYQVQGLTQDPNPLKRGDNSWIAGGFIDFTFEYRFNKTTSLEEWRIARWKDKAVTPTIDPKSKTVGLIWARLKVGLD